MFIFHTGLRQNCIDYNVSFGSCSMYEYLIDDVAEFCHTRLRRD